MFLPFGILYPIFNERATWKQTVVIGFSVSVAIELLQPIFGRSFDINDIILNGLGVMISTVVYFALRAMLQRRN